MSAVYRNLGDGANSAQPPRLLDRMRQVLRTKHYAYRTEQAKAPETQQQATRPLAGEPLGSVHF